MKQAGQEKNLQTPICRGWTEKPRSTFLCLCCLSKCPFLTHSQLSTSPPLRLFAEVLLTRQRWLIVSKSPSLGIQVSQPQYLFQDPLSLLASRCLLWLVLINGKWLEMMWAIPGQDSLRKTVWFIHCLIYLSCWLIANGNPQLGDKGAINWRSPALRITVYRELPMTRNIYFALSQERDMTCIGWDTYI